MNSSYSLSFLIILVKSHLNSSLISVLFINPPKLKLRDVPKEVNFLDSKKTKVGGMSAITHTINTNEIAYLRMYFDMNKVSFEDLPYVALLKRLFLNARITLKSFMKIWGLNPQAQ